MTIGGLQKTTLIDYPGKIACTIFLSGCNFRCPFCYSPELVLPEKIKSHPSISEKELFEFLESKKGLLEGIVFCGGEPTINKDLPVLIRKIKEMGFSAKLDTNGSNPSMLKDLISQNLLDYVAMDIKGPLKRYKEITRVAIDPENIKKSAELLKNSGIDYEFRTTVVPAIHSKEDIIKTAKEISPAKKYFLQSFLPEKTIDSEFEKLKPYPDSFIEEIIKEISPLFQACKAR